MARTALITGASSGIGATCAVALAAEGFRVFLTARRRQALEQVAERINAAHGEGDRAAWFAGDVTDASARGAAVQAMMDRWGRIDVLVNNAGYALPGVCEEVSLDDVRDQFEVNTFAALAMMQLVGPQMHKQGHGRIINMSSISGRLSFPSLGMYAASKHALEAISDAARQEFRPWNIRVALIEPNEIATDIWRRSRDLLRAEPERMRQSPFAPFYSRQARWIDRVLTDGAASADAVALAVCRAATARRPRARYCLPAKARVRMLMTYLPASWQDWLIRQALRRVEDR
ncbi:MAG: SDR family oxidoreductase [Phycisphaerae bacterium]|nr:SDR family oxidoreductase [Phycisphaerae bacterium]